MDSCPKQQSRYSYFEENMNDLGLAVPSSWFESSTKVTASLAALVAVAEKFGSCTKHERQLRAHPEIYDTAMSVRRRHNYVHMSRMLP